MIDPEQIAASEARYEQRSDQREETRAKLEQGRILDIEGPERVVRRVERLSFSALQPKLPVAVS